jgi:hypothetical protein
MARKRTSWRKHLHKQRQIARYEASLEAQAIEARLQAQLPTPAWDEVEAEWQARDDPDACLPQQRRDYLVRVATRFDVSLAGV